LRCSGAQRHWKAQKRKKTLELHLEGYLKAILAARTDEDNFHANYHGDALGKNAKHEHANAFGPSSAYFDGECLLALIKAAKYLGHDYLWPQIKASAEAGWQRNALEGLDISDGKGVLDKGLQAGALKRLNGYYQWGTMCWYELLGEKDSHFSKYAERTSRYSRYILAHKLSGTANKGYVFEGLIPAFVTAVQQGNEKLERKLACAIRHGVANLHKLQVSHTKAVDLMAGRWRASVDKAKDPRAQGGAQGSRESAALRIDTTQHQLHALLMAKRLVDLQALI